MGVQVGEGNTQIIYTYNRLTWTDGVAPPPLVSVSGVVDSPYRGLSAFEEQDAAFFFGREAAATRCWSGCRGFWRARACWWSRGCRARASRRCCGRGCCRGSGGRGWRSAPGSASWPCLVFTPTRVPLDELALRVAVLAGADAAAVRRGLDTDSEGFALTARQAALAAPPGPAGDPGDPGAGRPQPSPERRLLLVVDQFEQVFTQCADEGERRAFITALHAAGHGPDHAPAALVVLGVRADFEARCADYPQLSGAVQDRYLVTSMTERQLRMAITEPAKTAGSRVEDDLVEVLLTEVRTRQPGAGGAGVLPLLSHALDQAWRSRTGDVLTLADYERTGGIEGAVADSAQRAYDHLTPGQQAAARRVFTRLTVISTEGVDTADRATRAELAEGRSGTEVRDVEAVLEAFAAERLLTLAADSVEISHEILPAAWPLLRDTWLTETHADRIVRTRLRNTAADWERHSRDPSYLYSGSLLQAAGETAARVGADPARHPPLSQTERDFLSASGRAHQRGVRRRRAVIAGLLALTLAATTAAGVAVHNAANAARQHAIALSRLLDAESLAIDPTHPVIARRLAIAAWRVSPTGQADSVITHLLTEQQQKGILPADPSAVEGMAFSRDGKLLASAGGDGTVRLWDTVTRQPVGAPLRTGSGGQGGVFGVAFSPDGKLLASAGGDGTVRLWDTVTRQPVGAPLRATAGQTAVTGVAFSRDGKLLASAGADGTVRLWDTVTRQPVGAPLRAGAQTAVFGVVFSRDGKLLASAGADGTVRLWDTVTRQPVGAPLRTGSGGQGGVTGVAFSRDGKLLASAGTDGTVRLWDTVTRQPVGAPLRTGSGGQGGVTGVAFSRDGKLLASAGGDGTVRLWDTVTRQPVGAPLRATGPQGGVFGVVFSPDGKLLASADGDGTVRLWDTVTRQPVGAPLRATAGQTAVTGVAFSRDGKLLASAGGDGTVRLWDTVTRQPVGAPLRATAGQTAVTGVAFSRDGKLLASAGGDGTVRLWDTVTRQPVGAPLRATAGQTAVTGVAFSRDGKLLASAGGDGTVQLWDTVTRQPVGAPLRTGSGGQGGVTGVAFSPDGKLLASAGDDGTVQLWDTVTRQPVGAPLRATAGETAVTGVAFSRDGKLLASAGDDGTVQLWDTVTRQPVGAPLRTGSGGQGGVTGVAFSPDGKLLASAGDDGTVQLWDTVTRQPVGAPLRATAGQTAVTGVAFSRDGKLLASAGDDGTVRLWEVSLFTHPYAALCADVGPPTVQNWDQYAPGEPQPKVCA